MATCLEYVNKVYHNIIIIIVIVIIIISELIVRNLTWEWSAAHYNRITRDRWKIITK